MKNPEVLGILDATDEFLSFQHGQTLGDATLGLAEIISQSLSCIGVSIALCKIIENFQMNHLQTAFRSSLPHQVAMKRGKSFQFDEHVSLRPLVCVCPEMLVRAFRNGLMLAA
jgi:hypothetical protein